MFNSDPDPNPFPDFEPEHDPQEESWSDPPDEASRFEVPDYFPDELPLFMPGTLVRHRRYGYRGVVVDFDMTCHADDEWYNANPTHPDRDQPWYHVLVHGSTINTYAAQENLISDATGAPIDHPLVQHFFRAEDDQGYRRTDEPWPSFEE
jgi:heat shock protein HspQ